MKPFSYKESRAAAAKLTPIQRKQVKELIKEPMEHKYYEDPITDAFGVPSSGATYQLSLIPQGDTDSTRDGDRLTLTSVNIRGSVYCGDVTNLIRVIFYQWRPQSTPTITDILSKGADGTNIDVYSHYNHDKRSEFKILSDRTYSLAGYGTTVSPYGQDTEKLFNINISKKLIKNLQYVNGSTSVGSNQLWYLAISDSDATPNPTLTFKIRMNYIDA